MMTPYQEGALAASLGLTTEDNPYSNGSLNYRSWNEGYWDYINNKKYGV